MKNFYLLKQLFIVSIYLMVSGTSYAATIQVGADKTLKSIADALQIAQRGDTILVGKGTYREGNLVIDKSIALIGKEQPILDGEDTYEIISIVASDVVVDGFVLKNSGRSSVKDIAAIKAYDNKNIHIANNRIENSFFAIYFQACTQSAITNNTIVGYAKNELMTGNAVHAWKSDSLTISGNDITGHRDGIYLEFVTNTQVEKNIAQQNHRYGLHFMFSHDNAYYDNHFIQNGAGVAVMYTKNVRMERNTFEENWGDASYGLLLKDITDSYISNNTFTKNTTAILMEGSNRIHIEKNTIRSNGWGLKIQASCMDNTLVNNNFVANTFDVATNGSLVLNSFTGNYWDKYEGYDLDKDGFGDVPYRPVSLFSMIIERYPMAMLLFRSFMSKLLDRTERVMPSLTPENLKDDRPHMKPILA